jgi:cytochrome P450
MAPITEMGMTPARKQAALDANRAFCAYIEELVAQRRKRPGNGLIDHVIAAEAQEGAMSHEELASSSRKARCAYP